jgi:hypothetical protein
MDIALCLFEVPFPGEHRSEPGMADRKEEIVNLPIPPDIAERHASWRKLFLNANRGHYSLGVLSVASSSIAVVVGGFSAPAGQIFAGIAAVLTAMIGFLKPELKYLKFVRAWRILDFAVMKYRAGLISRLELIEAVGAGEAIITRMEDEGPSSVAQTTQEEAPKADEVQPQHENLSGTTAQT